MLTYSPAFRDRLNPTRGGTGDIERAAEVRDSCGQPSLGSLRQCGTTNSLLFLAPHKGGGSENIGSILINNCKCAAVAPHRRTYRGPWFLKSNTLEGCPVISGGVPNSPAPLAHTHTRIFGRIRMFAKCLKKSYCVVYIMWCAPTRATLYLT